MRTTWTVNRLVLVVAAYLALLGNFAFARHAAATLETDPHSLLHGATLLVALFCALVLLLSMFSFRRTVRAWLLLLLGVAAISAYFMDTFNVVVDSHMVLNVLSTDRAEASDLLTPRLVVYVLVLFVVPGVLVWRVRIRQQAAATALRARLGLVLGAFTTLAVIALPQGPYIATFVREHKPVRYYANPLTPLYAAYRFARDRAQAGGKTLVHLGIDAHVPAGDHDHELIVMVVGEAARADHFSLNGYARNTNRELVDLGVISFDHASACGTSTAISVPCMFSLSPADGFKPSSAPRTENVLDVLRHAGVEVLWRDNNSDSKGVALRVPHEDFRSPGRNPECDIECRDVGMLNRLQAFVDERGGGDILIVLHQMGSHGPAYFKRYPESWARFAPVCDTEQLDRCSTEQIVNTYDNTIRYTDHFLAQVLEFLQANDTRFETGLIYVGDHGESLGEGGLYLHGMPSWLAPREQTEVPLLLWFGEHNDDVDVASLRRGRHVAVSHDHVAHTLLGLFEVSTSVYEPGLDLLAPHRPSGERDHT